MQYILYAAIGLLAVMLFTAAVLLPICRAIRRMAGGSTVGLIVLTAVTFGFVQYGATKGGWSYGGGICADPDAPSAATGDVVQARWIKSGRVPLPASTPVTIYADREVYGWDVVGEAKVGDFAWSGEVANATNHDFMIRADQPVSRLSSKKTK